MTNSNGVNKEIQALLDAEKAARAAWYAIAPNGKADSKEQSVALRALEKAKVAFVKAVGAENFRGAAAKVGYSPQYATRVTKEKAPAPAKTPVTAGAKS